MGEKVYVSRFESPIGDIEIASTEKGICSISFEGDRSRSESATGAACCDSFDSRFLRILGAGYEVVTGTAADRANEPGLFELAEYFAGRLRRFSAPLDLRGTPFQLRVWNALLKIPYGEVRSYKQVAESVGNPLGARAVGAANSRNPVPVIVPCHRVVAADGTIGGFSGGGVHVKRRLLEIEGLRF